MAFEEYQLLRYFIPGSLCVAYFLLLAVPCLSSESIDFIVDKSEVLIAIIGAAFAASPAIGYVVYSFYTNTQYDNDSVTSKDKQMNEFMLGKIGENWGTIEIWRKKEFLDFLYFWDDKQGRGTLYYEKIHGIWNHFVARKISALYVPITIAVIFPICYFAGFLNNIPIFSLPNLRFFWLIPAIAAALFHIISGSIQNQLNLKALNRSKLNSLKKSQR
jgi:hypothetical protein